MSHPFYGRQSGRGSGGHVPLRVAQQLKDQRDRLFEELQEARRHNDRLASARRSESVEKEEWKRRARAAEAEARELREERQRLERRIESEAADAEPEVTEAEPAGADAELLTQLHQRIENLTDDLERVQRRTSETVETARRDERTRVLSGLGEVLDSVERALESGQAPSPWRQGLEAIRSQLLAFFRGEGATLLGEIGDEMDPHLHEAVDVMETDEFQKGKIVRVDRRGIRLEDGTVVRPARVAVAA